MKNKHRFVTNQNFQNVFEINQYLRFWGKIPQFLELRSAGSKGYGVFSMINLQKLTFLGYYSGITRPPGIQHNKSAYNFVTQDFDSKRCAIIDAENLTFSNFSRYINDGKNHNIEYCIYNMQIYIFTLTDIKAGEELIGNYGDEYWNGMAAKGIAKSD